MKVTKKAGRKPVPIENRFWTKVKIGMESECWEWQGSVAHVGYGFIWFEGKQSYAHRWAYRLSKGEIARGLYVCHRCDNKLCCNPAHLFLGTNRENQRDKNNKGRQARGSMLPHTKLSPEIVTSIRALVSGGMLQADVAAKFSVTQSTISRIVTGQRWSYVKKVG